MAKTFRFVRSEYGGGEARLVYAFDDGPELVERIGFRGCAEHWHRNAKRRSRQRSICFI